MASEQSNTHPEAFSPSFRFDQGITHVPIWVKFSNLDLQFESLTGLSKQASTIGNPLFVDRCAALKEQINYARVLVETDVSSNLPMTVFIRDPLVNILTFTTNRFLVLAITASC